MPSPDEPLAGACACGTIRFQVTAPFTTAGYCHCKRCQQRSGALWALNAMLPAAAFEILQGANAIGTWRPPDGLSKSFCTRCGGHVFSGDPAAQTMVGVRLGAVQGDPGIRPSWHQWVESAPEWEPLPDDGLPRFAQQRQTD